jgi:tetratricopeptide (TPR) repeat protein
VKKLIITIIILLYFANYAAAQNIDSLLNLGKQLLDKGSTYFDEGSLIEAEQKFQQILDLSSESYLAQYFLAYTDYRLAVYYRETKDAEQFNNYISLSENELEAILDSNDTNSEVLSLLASAYGEQIKANSDSAKHLAPKALLLISKALNLDPDNPRVHLLAGKLFLNLPEKYGGDKQKSLEYLRKSVQLFEANQDADDELEWGYIFALTWLGKNYMELNDYSAAVDIYNKALEVSPDFLWIKNILLPEAADKLNSNDE